MLSTDIVQLGQFDDAYVCLRNCVSLDSTNVLYRSLALLCYDLCAALQSHHNRVDDVQGSVWHTGVRTVRHCTALHCRHRLAMVCIERKQLLEAEEQVRPYSVGLLVPHLEHCCTLSCFAVVSCLVRTLTVRRSLRALP